MVDLEEPGLQNCFSLSGWAKILESCMIFICLMIHRIGDNGSQVGNISGRLAKATEMLYSITQLR